MRIKRIKPKKITKNGTRKKRKRRIRKQWKNLGENAGTKNKEEKKKKETKREETDCREEKDRGRMLKQGRKKERRN